MTIAQLNLFLGSSVAKSLFSLPSTITTLFSLLFYTVCNCLQTKQIEYLNMEFLSAMLVVMRLYAHSVMWFIMSLSI